MPKRYLKFGIGFGILLFVCRVAGLSLKLVPVLTKAQVEGSEKYVRTNVAITRKGALHNFTMDLEVTVLAPLHELTMYMALYMRFRNSDNWILNKTVNFCTFLQRPNIDRIAGLVHEELRQHGNMPLRCPVMPDSYMFENVTLNQVKLPAFLPESNFGLTVNMLVGPSFEHIFRSTWYGRFRKVMI